MAWLYNCGQVALAYIPHQWNLHVNVHAHLYTHRQVGHHFTVFTGFEGCWPAWGSIVHMVLNETAKLISTLSYCRQFLKVESHCTACDCYLTPSSFLLLAILSHIASNHTRFTSLPITRFPGVYLRCFKQLLLVLFTSDVNPFFWEKRLQCWSFFLKSIVWTLAFPLAFWFGSQDIELKRVRKVTVISNIFFFVVTY
jgi:hypothetical protein